MSQQKPEIHSSGASLRWSWKFNFLCVFDINDETQKSSSKLQFQLLKVQCLNLFFWIKSTRRLTTSVKLYMNPSAPSGDCRLPSGWVTCVQPKRQSWGETAVGPSLLLFRRQRRRVYEHTNLYMCRWVCISLLYEILINKKHPLFIKSVTLINLANLCGCGLIDRSDLIASWKHESQFSSKTEMCVK